MKNNTTLYNLLSNNDLEGLRAALLENMREESARAAGKNTSALKIIEKLIKANKKSSMQALQYAHADGAGNIYFLDSCRVFICKDSFDFEVKTAADANYFNVKTLNFERGAERVTIDRAELDLFIKTHKKEKKPFLFEAAGVICGVNPEYLRDALMFCECDAVTVTPKTRNDCNISYYYIENAETDRAAVVLPVGNIAPAQLAEYRQAHATPEPVSIPEENATPEPVASEEINPADAERVLYDYYDFYSKLYGGNIAEDSSRIDRAEAFIRDENNAGYIRVLISTRGDLFTSDRELDALCLALEKHGIIDAAPPEEATEAETLEAIEDTIRSISYSNPAAGLHVTTLAYKIAKIYNSAENAKTTPEPLTASEYTKIQNFINNAKNAGFVDQLAYAARLLPVTPEKLALIYKAVTRGGLVYNYINALQT